MDALPASSPPQPSEAYGLAMSGGGFRSTLFQLGSAWRMHELGLLESLSAISGVSGGAITAAWLVQNWSRLYEHGPSPEAGATSFRSLIVEPLMHFCSQDLDGHEPSNLKRLARGWGLPFRSLRWERRLSDLFGQASLASLSGAGRPELIVLATNLPTAAPIELSSLGVREPRLGSNSSLPEQLSIARAIAGSSAFPGWFRPLIKDTQTEHWEPPAGLDAAQLEAWAEVLAQSGGRLQLADGGILDNLAISPLWDRPLALFISDASTGRRELPGPEFAQGSRARVLDRGSDLNEALSALARRRPLGQFPGAAAFERGMQRYRMLADCLLQYSNTGQALIRLRLSETLEAQRRGAYWRIGGSLPETAGQSQRSTLQYAPLARLRTSLNRFSEAEQKLLVNWGYLLADSALERWALQPAPLALPFAEE